MLAHMQDPGPFLIFTCMPGYGHIEPYIMRANNAEDDSMGNAFQTLGLGRAICRPDPQPSLIVVCVPGHGKTVPYIVRMKKAQEMVAWCMHARP